MAAIFGSDEGPLDNRPRSDAVADAGADAVPDAGDLYRRHYLHLTRLAAMVVGDRETAEDVVQDVFARMQRRWRRLSDPQRAERYLRAAVVNGARSVLRRRRVAARHQPDRPGSEQPAELSALDRLRTTRCVLRWCRCRRGSSR